MGQNLGKDGPVGGLSNWFIDSVSAENDAAAYVGFRVKKHIFETKTDFHQQLQILDLSVYGPTLILDGVVQNALSDERLFNSLLVHPALLLHPCPKHIFVAGGAAGSPSREALRHLSVQSVTQVEIDARCAQVVREQFFGESQMEWANDPRYDFRIGDALEFLKTYPPDAPRFDVIVMDVSDPLAGGPCYEMFTMEFYQHCRDELLSPDGFITTHATSASMGDNAEVFSAIVKTFHAVFGEEGTMAASRFIPVFLAKWGFVVACKNPSLLNRLGIGIDALIEERIRGGADVLQSYDEETHRKAFALDKHVRKVISEEKRVITMANPCFVGRGEGNGGEEKVDVVAQRQQ